MRLVIQRVKSGAVVVNDEEVGATGAGLVVLVGILDTDTEADVKWAATRILGIKLWPNEGGTPWRRSVANLGLGVLVVSQFTLPAKLGPKHVPDFRKAMAPSSARVLYNQLATSLRAQHQKKGDASGSTVAEGIFGADMQVHLVNDGPVTILLDSPEPPAPASAARPAPNPPDANLNVSPTPALTKVDVALTTETTSSSIARTATLEADAQPPAVEIKEGCTAKTAPLTTPLLPSSATAWPAHSPSDSPTAVAEAFRRDGFVVLQSLLPLPLVERAKKAAAANFAACQNLIEARELDFGMHTAAGFREIVQRNQGRFEVPFGLAESPVFQAPELVRNPRLIAVLDAILGDKPVDEDDSKKGTSESPVKAGMCASVATDAPTVSEAPTASVLPTATNTTADRATETAATTATKPSSFGGRDAENGAPGSEDETAWRLLGRSVVVALPGALEQPWHVDGAHVDLKAHQPCHVLNVFLPLVDLTLANGPTELRPGSQFVSRDLARLTLLAKVKKQWRPPVQPCLKAGDALVFDYRTLHRGRANSSTDTRPVLVMTFAKSWFRDLYNFPKRSLYDDPTPPPPPPPSLPPPLLSPSSSPASEIAAASAADPATKSSIVRVGVVIPTRGTKLRSLARAVQSVWRQTINSSLGSSSTSISSNAKSGTSKGRQSAHSIDLAESSQLELIVVIVIDGPQAPHLPTEAAYVASALAPAPAPAPTASSSGPPGQVHDENFDDDDDDNKAIRAALLGDNRQRVRVVRLAKASGGRPGIVRNAGLNHCQDCEWVAFLDDDDEWLPGKLQQQLVAATSNTSDFVCSGALEDHAFATQQLASPTPLTSYSPLPFSSSSSSSFSTSSPLVLESAPTTVPLECTLPRGWDDLPELLTQEHFAGGVNPVVCSSVLVRRAALEARSLRFSDASYGQDLDLWKRCLAPSVRPPSSAADVVAAAAVSEKSTRMGFEGQGVGVETSAAGAAETATAIATATAAALPPLRCAFVREPLVVVGTMGLERSTVRKEQRQAVQALLHNANAPPATAGRAQSLINGFLGL